VLVDLVMINLGEAITIAKNERQFEEIFNNYVLGDTEPIFSKLGNESALRMHLLAAIAYKFCKRYRRYLQI